METLELTTLPMARLHAKLNKARALLESGAFEQALAVLEPLAVKKAQDPQLYSMLGFITGRLGRAADSALHYSRASELAPQDLGLIYNRGIALRNIGDMEAASKAMKEVLARQPQHRDAANILAQALIHTGKLDQAQVILETAIHHHPRDAELHANLGAVLKNLGYADAAVEWYHKALKLNPALPAHDSLASALAATGRLDESVAMYRDCLARQPRNYQAYSNMLLTLNYLPDIAPEELFRAHLGWQDSLGARQIRRHAPQTDPGKRLRIGYVSPDFRNHSVANFLEPLLAAHDHGQFEIFCYATSPVADDTTARLRALTEQWRDAASLSPAQLAAAISADSIDILVDLAGHTAHNSLPAFALKPAPIQITWLGYPNTTGLDTMDYRLTDAVADPEDQDSYHSETLLRLPGCFLCYRPPQDAPDVSTPPALRNGHITLGSFNNLSKMNEQVLNLWADLLDDIPGSRLLIKNPSLTDPRRQRALRETLVKRGADPARVELLGHTPGRAEHLALYSRIDIALDTFPYNGTTTSCEALHMGVPVVTLSGAQHRNRVGASLLEAAGCAQWIATNETAYRAVVRELAASPAALAATRNQLRAQLATSMLCDQQGFARRVEVALRNIWHRWCSGG